MRFTGFIGPSYTATSVNVDCQRCMNLYPEIDSLGTGKDGEVASLVSTPGLTLKCTLPTSPVRGVFQASNGKVFAVGGQYAYSISSSWVVTQLGQLNTSTGAVSMADNGIQLVIVDGSGATGGYYVTLSNNAFTQINDANFLGADLVTYQDGYFIFNKTGSPFFFCSDLNAVTFNALNTAAKSGYPDNLIGHISCSQNLYLFGAQSSEVWYDAGTTPCPFARLQGAMIQVGCIAKNSIARLQNMVYWLGGDENGQGIVYSMQGYSPQRVSTPAIESQIRSVGISNMANARAWVYEQGGHVFYCLNVPGLSSTWVYDVSTGFWHERTFTGLWGFERHKADCATLAYGLNVVGDYSSGNIYALDSTKYSDNGTSIVRLRASPHLSKDMVRLFHSSFQLDMETGVGVDGSGQGTDPQVMLQWSDDGGHKWSNEHWTSAGKIGATKYRVIFRRLGSSRSRVYRVVISDPVKVTLIGAELGTEQGVA